MQQLEKLYTTVPEVDISYDDLMPKALSGLYSNNRIRLNPKNDYYKNVAVLAEEIGHHYTSYGDSTWYKENKYCIDSARQELRARRFGVKLILPLDKLIDCYKSDHWGDICTICLHLEVEPSYFHEIIEDYKKKFGAYVEYDGYLIEFNPLNIRRLR